MNTTLYRKYRPQKFSDVKGQGGIVDTLQIQIKNKTIGHAYLFSGGRGTGKTTVARIFARAVGVADEDLYELDAASNRTIDDIRDLREAVKTLPFSSPYKCYIIDEVHMLTKEAFNALLKTLEEPPAHVLFILATTNDEKIPDTIVSRCQTFRFLSPRVDILREHISEVAKCEEVLLDVGASNLIAFAGDGSFRDALSILEKVLTHAGKGSALNENSIAEIIGAPKTQTIHAILNGISKKDSREALLALQNAQREHVDMQFLYRLILLRVRSIMLLRYAPEYGDDLQKELSPEEFHFILELSKQQPPAIHSQTLTELLSVSQFLKTTSIPSLPLELAIIKLTT